MIRYVRIPAKFYTDHEERGLPTPKAHRTTKQAVWIYLNDPDIDELLDDARHYANDVDACDRGLVASARATVRNIEKERALARGLGW